MRAAAARGCAARAGARCARGRSASRSSLAVVAAAGGPSRRSPRRVTTATATPIITATGGSEVVAPPRRHDEHAQRLAGEAADAWTNVLVSIPKVEGRDAAIARRRAGAPARACDRSASSTRRASRASIPATGSSSPASTRASPRRRAASGRQRACNDGAAHRPRQPLIRCSQMAISCRVCNTSRKPIDWTRSGRSGSAPGLLTDFSEGVRSTAWKTTSRYLQSCMYQYSRAIYRSIKDLIDPYTDHADAARVAPQSCSRSAS